MEVILVEWCSLHFNQAAETTLARRQWEKCLNVLDPDHKIEEIMEGRYEIPNLDITECMEWIKGMKNFGRV